MKKFLVLLTMTIIIVCVDLKITAMFTEQPTPFDIQTNELPNVKTNPIIKKPFPEISGTTLSNKKVTLPEDIKGNIGIIVLNFKKNNQKIVNEWRNAILEQYGDKDYIAYYEIPVISWLYKPVSRFINKGFKTKINEPLEDNILPAYGRQKKYTFELKIKDLKSPYIFLLDKQGKIAQVYQGEPTPDKIDNLKMNIKLLKQQ